MSDSITEMELVKMIKSLALDSAPNGAGLSDYSKEEALGGHKENTNRGWFSVSGNEIFVHTSDDEMSPLTIEAIPPVKLTVNGEAVSGTVTVTSKDKLEWSVEESPLFEIQVSEDRMQAYLLVHSPVRYVWKLSECEPAAHLVLRAEEDQSIILNKLEFNDIILELDRLSITKNRNIGAVFEEVLNPTFEPILIARGKPPVPGKDAELQLFFTEQVENQYVEIGGVVDYRNHLNIPSVTPGDVIARKIPPEEGTVGYDVYGNFIRPKEPKDIVIVAKDGVQIREDGFVIALREGRPRITGNQTKFFDITKAYIVPGDVNIETGHIVFSGDIIIYGNVMESMIVESLGNVYISGSVYNATVTATGSIYIQGNAIKSNLYSGYFGVLYNRLYNNSKLLMSQFEQLLEAAKLLFEMVEKKGQKPHYGQIILLLVENKFKDIYKLAKEALSVIINIRSRDKTAWLNLKDMLERFLQLSRMPQLISLGTILGILNSLRETVQHVGSMQEAKVRIDIGQCHLSTLKSNGDILIRKEGVLQSDLYSAANIVFYDKDAVCRGSRLEADGMISAMMVGGQTGAPSVLRSKTKIILKSMSSGRVCIENYCIEILEHIENQTIDMEWVKSRVYSARGIQNQQTNGKLA
ncbi:FapA family protein [Paenibacillus sp. YK5]